MTSARIVGSSENHYFYICSAVTILAILSLFSYAPKASAHAFSPSLLQLTEFEEDIFEVKWKVPIKQMVRISPLLPKRCLKISDVTTGVEGTGKTATWKIRCPENIIGEKIGVTFEGAGKERATALVHIDFLDNYSVGEILTSDSSTVQIKQKADKLSIAKDYSLLGIEHILTGFDHLLFVFGLLLLVGVNRSLLWTITAFTIGHSITLGISVFDLFTVSQAAVEALIAFSIYILGLEIIRTRQGKKSWFKSRPWLVAGGFGLLHGMGFAGALAKIGLPKHEIPVALVSFNVGIELGQLAFISGLLVIWKLFQSIGITLPVILKQAPAYAIGSIAAFWTIERSISIFQ